MPGLVLAGTRSGVGKTVAALATMRALEGAGYEVQPAKAGPDFIDPSQHAATVGKPSRTLDCWLAGEEGTRRNYARGTGDVCVVEGVMGMYDGSDSSTAAVAEALGLPVVLVVDGEAGMESVAATAMGFRDYASKAGRDVDVVGVLAQRTHPGRHAAGVRDALPEGLDFVGNIPPAEDLEIPERHLGLHGGQEAALAEEALAAAAEHLDAELVADLAEPAIAPEQPAPSVTRRDSTIAVARDEAFKFIYPATAERLRALATVEQFSPVAGDDLPDCDAVYLPGGYPELHAETLADSETLAQIGGAAADGMPIYAECGGFMALAESLTTVEGDTHEMAGVLPASVRMHDRYQALDYVELQPSEDSVVATTGTSLRGHEFHYSSADVAGDASFAFDVDGGVGIDDGRDGMTEYRTVGTYTHVHAESGAFDRLVEAAHEGE